MTTAKRQEGLRPLTKQEIDRRIGDLLAEVAEVAELENDPAVVAESETPPPRWICPAELVRRLRPFVVYN